MSTDRQDFPEEACSLPEPLRHAFQQLHERMLAVINGYVSEHDLVAQYGEEEVDHMGFHAMALTLASMLGENYRQGGPEHLQEAFHELYHETQSVLEQEDDGEDEDKEGMLL
ncbi:hypothetical protein HY496_02040 [Candidatus Woesearchaeota archaeon]|nr:hypothetical protein [Candidatus Woesearchaeota archaeon]